MSNFDGKTHLLVRNVLEEALEVVQNSRQESYGHPLDDFSRTAKMWSAILGIEVRPEQIPLCMIAVKISRECHQPKRDNLVDIAGYTLTLEMVINALEARAYQDRADADPRAV